MLLCNYTKTNLFKKTVAGFATVFLLKLITSFCIAVNCIGCFCFGGCDLFLEKIVVKLLVDGKINFLIEPIRKVHSVRKHKSVNALTSVRNELAAVEVLTGLRAE